MKICSVEGCGRKHEAKGFCIKHYCEQPYIKERQKTNFIRWYELPGNKEKCRNTELVKAYGKTLDWYNQIFGDQNGRCKICGRHQSEFKKRLSIDHNHLTGEVRGLLCNKCNHEVGLYEIFQTDPEKVKKIKEYLHE